MTDPPTVDPDLLAAWRWAETADETVFALGPFRVTVGTVVYEDETLRDRVREATGVDRTWRFFFASRVVVPGATDSPLLAALVRDRAEAGFLDRLADRGFEDVREAGRRRLHVGTVEAEAVRYDTTCLVGDAVLDVEGWLAVWPGAGGYLLAGGAFPRRVRRPPAAGDPLSDRLDPAGFRDELFDLIRATG